MGAWLLHGYDSIDRDVVWRVISEQLTQFAMQARHAMQRLESNAGTLTLSPV